MFTFHDLLIEKIDKAGNVISEKTKATPLLLKIHF